MGDFQAVIKVKEQLLDLAFARFQRIKDVEYDKFTVQNADWLEDFALFSALKEHNGSKPWVEWPEAEALRFPEALKAAHETLKIGVKISKA